jgi:hypothetical protein
MPTDHERKILPKSVPLVIAGAAGAWGDSSFAITQLLQAKSCHYIVFEALAEITMGILTRAKQRNPNLGYATDIIDLVGEHLAELAAQKIKVITNAGGVHPEAAAAQLRRWADRSGLSLKVATVIGDDVMEQLRDPTTSAYQQWKALGNTEEPWSFHAYLGAFPIAAALKAGADIVITGRCVDSALVLGPLIHEFGWTVDNLDCLSQGSLAGHLLECGPQASGGTFTDWQDFPSWEDIGYPIAHCYPDGSFVITKPEGTGGLVNEATVAEQMLYEIGDPAAYLLPDVRCDWRTVALEKIAPDCVRVRGAKGYPPPPNLKACALFPDGYKLSLLMFLAGEEAVPKAKRLIQDVKKRVQRVLNARAYEDLRAMDTEILGAESTYGPHSRSLESREVIIKFAFHHRRREALETLVRELPSFGLAVPGLSGGGTGLPKATPVVRLQSVAVPQGSCSVSVMLDGKLVPTEDHEFVREYSEFVASSPTVPWGVEQEGVPTIDVPLIVVAHARSGDKGSLANIGVRARHPDFFPWLCAHLTSSRVAELMAHRISGTVERFELPGIHSLNFVLYDALGGGGVSSLRFDPQGKAYAQQLLAMIITVPRSWMDHPSWRMVNKAD